eukprot:TRINITY_DN8510_c0_g1_i1.p1 TRINITY_DN8510_c0_g1~~TRINITY_DN8510_c0_g1_i1.p1  ORF type:complete len:642 (+),score=57.74 TRINITY_DN8510_c0_g1_i1:61-1926(+)
MGISGLLQSLKPHQRSISVGEYANSRVGVDVYAWLHRAAIGCASELAHRVPTGKYISYIMQRVQMLRAFRVEPVLVFDGGALPSKQNTEEERRRARERNLQAALEQVRQGKSGDEFFQRAVDVTPEMACSLIQALRAEGVEFVVAPFEADAQLAFLAIQGYISAVITEDSDLVAYCTPRVLFKMDKTGQGMELRTADLACVGKEPNFINFTPDMILTTCILAGCDYLPSLNGIGFKTAHRLVREHKNIDRIVQVLQVDSRYNVSGRELQRYAEAFEVAFRTFRHHRVYDPRTREVVSVNPLPHGVDVSSWPFLGEPISTAAARSVCEGFSNPYTLERYPTEPMPDAKAYLGVKHRRVAAPVASSISEQPPSAAQLYAQKKVTSYFIAQTSASKQPFKPPQTPTRTSSEAPPFFHGANSNEDAPDEITREEARPVEVEEEFTGTVAVPPVTAIATPNGGRKKRVKLSRYFYEFHSPPAADGAPPGEQEPPEPAPASDSQEDKEETRSLCPHGNIACTVTHSIFMNCVSFMRVREELGPPPPEIPDLMRQTPTGSLHNKDQDSQDSAPEKADSANEDFFSAYSCKRGRQETNVPAFLRMPIKKARASPLINSSLGRVGIGVRL